MTTLPRSPASRTLLICGNCCSKSASTTLPRTESTLPKFGGKLLPSGSPQSTIFARRAHLCRSRPKQLRFAQPFPRLSGFGVIEVSDRRFPERPQPCRHFFSPIIAILPQRALISKGTTQFPVWANRPLQLACKVIITCFCKLVADVHGGNLEWAFFDFFDSIQVKTIPARESFAGSRLAIPPHHAFSCSSPTLQPSSPDRDSVRRRGDMQLANIQASYLAYCSYRVSQSWSPAGGRRLNYLPLRRSSRSCSKSFRSCEATPHATSRQPRSAWVAVT